MILRVLAMLMLLAGLTGTAADAQPRRDPPYWASIASGQAMMRTGPGRNYPGTWLYLRRDLPVRVVGVHQSWRKIQDPDGTTGWMLVNLLSDTRTAIVRGEDPRPIYAQPVETSPLSFRAEPGVVGRIAACANGWCRLDVAGRRGYIRSDHIWGTDAADPAN